MRTITFNAYQLDELSEGARKNAIDNMRSKVGEMLCEFDAEEYRDALKEIEKIFGIKVYDWGIGYPSTYFRWRFTNERWGELCDNPKFLPRYWNAIERYCRKGRYYSGSWRNVPKSKECPAGVDCLTRNSRVMWVREYALTGTWTSKVVDDYTETKIWEYVRERKTIEDFIEDMLYDFFNQWECDQDANYEDEAIEETILGNDYEFTEEGVRYIA